MFDRLNPDRPIPDRPIDPDRTLDDGSTYRIRPSGTHDRALVAAFFEALSPHSRRMRFFVNKRSLTPDELDLFCGADGHDHLALAAVRTDATGREIEPLGFARCLRLAPGGETAELSIAVADRAQGQGLGGALLERLCTAALAQGIRRFRFEVLAENRGMRQLAQRLGGEAQWLGDGVVEYDCALPEPGALAPGPETVPEPAPEPAGPTAPETAGDLPWFLDPDAWMAPWTATWHSNLDLCLAWVQASNEDLGQWMEAECPPGATRWRAAA